MPANDTATIQRALHDHLVGEILLRKTPLSPDEDLFDAGFDSLSLSRILVFIEQRFGLVIPDQDVVIDEMATLEKMTDSWPRGSTTRDSDSQLASCRAKHWWPMASVALVSREGAVSMLSSRCASPASGGCDAPGLCRGIAWRSSRRGARTTRPSGWRES